jgi:hypothetical protein
MSVNAMKGSAIEFLTKARPLETLAPASAR